MLETRPESGKGFDARMGIVAVGVEQRADMLRRRFIGPAAL